MSFSLSLRTACMEPRARNRVQLSRFLYCDSARQVFLSKVVRIYVELLGGPRSIMFRAMFVEDLWQTIQ